MDVFVDLLVVKKAVAVVKPGTREKAVHGIEWSYQAS